MSMMPKNKLDFEYKLTGIGWSSCQFSINTETVFITASYLSDALGELAQAIEHIVDGGEKARCSFEEEPGEYRWNFKRLTENGVQITLLSFNDAWDKKSDSEGQVLVDELCDVKELVIAAKNMLERVLLENGIEGYKKNG